MTDALICIGSPLQAICAVEAIREYRIEKYKLFVIDDGTRLNQIKRFLDDKGMEYSVIPFHVPSWKNILRMVGCFNPFRGTYDYLLMGDYRLTGYRMEYLPLVKNGGKIVFLDDGSYIVSWAKGLIEEKGITKLRNKMMETVCKFRGISHNNIFTMFAKDIQMPDYNIKENHLTQLQMSEDTISNDIYFIGTNPNPLGEGGYCPFMEIDFSYYLSVLENLLSKLQRCNPHSRIIYIPHGRDVSEETKDICERLNITYMKIPTCVELFVLSLGCCPKEIWGFSSTALYTLRRLCGRTRIYNVIIKGANSNAFEQYREIAAIYSHNNMENVWM